MQFHSQFFGACSLLFDRKGGGVCVCVLGGGEWKYLLTLSFCSTFFLGGMVLVKSLPSHRPLNARNSILPCFYHDTTDDVVLNCNGFPVGINYRLVFLVSDSVWLSFVLRPPWTWHWSVSIPIDQCFGKSRLFHRRLSSYFQRFAAPSCLSVRHGQSFHVWLCM